MSASKDIAFYTQSALVTREYGVYDSTTNCSLYTVFLLFEDGCFMGYGALFECEHCACYSSADGGPRGIMGMHYNLYVIFHLFYVAL